MALSQAGNKTCCKSSISGTSGEVISRDEAKQGSCPPELGTQSGHRAAPAPWPSPTSSQLRALSWEAQCECWGPTRRAGGQ